MALGKKKQVQGKMWIATNHLPKSPGHPFYRKLNELLREISFDAKLEELCAPHYKKTGRPSIPPGVYFRMLIIGYFEGLDSQRAIAWRCKDSLSVREFLGLDLEQESPDHSSLTVIRQRLPLEVHQEVFGLILALARKHHLIDAKAVAVDSTMIEANAAMKSIVRRDTDEDWRAYVKRLAVEEGAVNPTDEDARRMDRARKGKKVSNQDWQSPSDPDSRIARMKDGRTHLAYKPEHALDLKSEIILAAEVYRADRADSDTITDTINEARVNLLRAGSDATILDAVADKGYHKAETLADCQHYGVRTYIPERKSKHRSRWQTKPHSWKQAVLSNRRRVRGPRSRRLQRQRSERVERSFAQLCNIGRMRRSWIRGVDEVGKRYVIHAAGRNLGRMMFLLFGIGSARGLMGSVLAKLAGLLALWLCAAVSAARTVVSRLDLPAERPRQPNAVTHSPGETGASSTDC
jgi:transposase